MIETDQQLVVRVLGGDADGVARLIERYGAALRRVLLRAGASDTDVDDLLQETWIRVVRSASRYDPLQPFQRWLFAIAMNRFRTRAGRAAEEARKREPIENVEPAVESTHDAAETAQRALRVRELVAGLPPHLADAVLLRYFEELSEREVAVAMGVPIGTVKSRLHTAIARLRLAAKGAFHE